MEVSKSATAFDYDSSWLVTNDVSWLEPYIFDSLEARIVLNFSFSDFSCSNVWMFLSLAFSFVAAWLSF